MVGLEILAQINPQKHAEFLQAYEMVKSIDVEDDARLSLSLFKKVDDPDIFLWVEHWRDRESLDHYYKGKYYRGMLGAIGILGELVYQKTCVFEEGNQDGK